MNKLELLDAVYHWARLSSRPMNTEDPANFAFWYADEYPNGDKPLPEAYDTWQGVR